MPSAKKPPKPYPDFPLFPHATKRWAKKIRGKLHYFGPWDDWQGALQKFLDERDDLYAGRVPAARDPDALTVRDACNLFLESKQRQVAAGLLTQKTWKGYLVKCRRLSNHFGTRAVSDLRPTDFEVYGGELSKTNKAMGLRNHITVVRMVFNYLYESEMIDKPVRFGPQFKRPSKRIIRQQKANKMMERDDINQLLSQASVNMRAMILLGVNCGLGGTDIAGLKESHIDGTWLRYPRQKTGVSRNLPMWDETRQALAQALERRPQVAGDTVFITRKGKPFDPDYVSEVFRRFLETEGIHRTGLGFYCLRHVHATIGGDSRDAVAVGHLMGHISDSMTSEYRERIDPQRLVDVTDHIRRWLFDETP